MNCELQRQISEHRQRRARMGAPLTMLVPVLPKPPPAPIKPIRLIREQMSAQLMPIIVTGFWGHHALMKPSLRKSASTILAEVSEETGFSIKDLKGPSRMAAVSHARHWAMWRIRKECPHLSYPQIARLLGRTNHTTVLHGFRKIEAMRKMSEAVAA